MLAIGLPGVDLALPPAGGVGADSHLAWEIAGAVEAGDPPLIVPVPLHRWRLWSRGYNQAGLIAAALSRGSGVKSAMDLLRRRRATPVLRGRNPRERRQAVAGAFAVAPGAADRLRGRHVVLVDDVYTSGATTDACIAVLRRAGVARVTVLAWARVIVEAQEA